jgi:hypothetical protein
MKQELIDYVKKQYSDEAAVASQIDEVIPDYLDDDWEDKYDNAYDAYLETGRGEAESQIVNELSNGFLKEKGISEQDYYNEIDENTWDTIHGVYEILDK